MDLKQAMIIRNDFKLSKGKTVITTVRASIAAAEKSRSSSQSKFKRWMSSGQKKVVLKVHNQEEMAELIRLCGIKGINVVSFTLEDLGLSAEKEIAVIGIGPDIEKKIDSLTGRLKLL